MADERRRLARRTPGYRTCSGLSRPTYLYSSLPLCRDRRVGDDVANLEQLTVHVNYRRHSTKVLLMLLLSSADGLSAASGHLFFAKQ